MTATNGGRIGRVKFKNGAEVRILENRNTGDPDVVNLLLTLLNRARKGELVAFAMVSVNPRGTVGTAWANGDGSHHHELASGALTLANRIGGS
jgi:hypothetical protein